MDQLVLVIIAANVLFSWKGLNDYTFFEKYKFQVGPILHGEKIRMISSGFLHVDYMHLGFNMYALYIFSDVVLYRMGTVSFLVLYMGSLLAGSILSFLYNKSNSYYSAVGASGAVSGVVYSAIMFNPDMNLNFILFPFIDIPGHVFGLHSEKFSINLTEGFGAGVLYPRTNTTLLGKERHDDFHVSGFGVSARVGLDIAYKGFFVMTEFKTGYINMQDIKTTNSSADSASQTFGYIQPTIVLGGRFYLKKQKK